MPAPPPGFDRVLGLSPFQAHLAYNRGIKSRRDLEGFLNPGLWPWHDPMLLPDMGQAVQRLTKALDAGEVIGVFGDFDTDGVAGTALLVLALRELGAEVLPYLPDRVDEGHGLNAGAVRSLASRGVSLLITVDCGASSAEEVEMASSLGVDTVITDHHTLSETLPRAVAVVNPGRPDSEYPYASLTGAGLALKLAQALWAVLGRPEPDHLVDLAALGTVADVGPLTGENRYLVQRGLERMNTTEHPGLTALIDRSGLKSGSIDTEALSFGLIPRLNAAGRLAHASTSLELLTATSAEDARHIAEELDVHNQRRRLLSEESMRQATEQVEAHPVGPPPIIIVEHRDWAPGILGLVAGNLAEMYYRPAVAVQTGDQVCRASARSIPEFDMAAALRSSSGLFLRFGGHPQAAGFTALTEDLSRIRAALMRSAEEALAGMELAPSIEIDCEISPALLDRHNFDFIQSLGPFGEGNPTPVFLTRNATAYQARQVGATGAHLKMRIGHGGEFWDAIAFRQGEHAPGAVGRLDLVYTAAINDWGGRPTLQLQVLDFHSNGRTADS